MSHTPGPWRIVQAPVGLAIVGMRGTQGEPVAQLYNPFPDVERDNASLIAAAPELLEVLAQTEGFLKAFFGLIEYNHLQDANELGLKTLQKRIYVELAKARGEIRK